MCGFAQQTPHSVLTAAEEDAKTHGKAVEETYFFYTTCPKCAKTYGKNYVVTVSRVH